METAKYGEMELAPRKAKEILASGLLSNRVWPECAMKVLGLDAQAADSALRRLAAAGFLEYDQDARRPGWSLTGAGRRLALDPLRPRFGRDKADQIIAAVTARARLINSDPDRLHRVKLRLFGSALDTDRHDFGDVDISVDILPRFLETTERERILDLIKGRTPSSATRTIIGGLFAEHAQDSREIKATLKKGLRNLSLMTDDLMELGVPFRVIVDHDLARDVPLEPPQEIVRPNRKPEEAPPRNLDGVTTILEPRGRIRNPARRVANRDVRLNARDMLEMEADAWTPTWEGGKPTPKRLSTPSERFAGCHNLCPVWKEPVGGLEMLRRAVAWCEENGAWPSRLTPVLSLRRAERSRSARLGSFHPYSLWVERVADTIDADLVPSFRRTVSPVDVAGAFAVATAIGRCIDESNMSKMRYLHASFWLPDLLDLDAPTMPDLRKMSEMEEGSLQPRPVEWVTTPPRFTIDASDDDALSS